MLPEMAALPAQKPHRAYKEWFRATPNQGRRSTYGGKQMSKQQAPTPEPDHKR